MVIGGNFMELLGQILWFLMFATPLLTVPLVWKYSKYKKVFRIIIGVVLACLLSLLLYFSSLAIIFRDGMGP